MKKTRSLYLSSLIFLLAWIQTAVFAFDCESRIPLDPSDIEKASYSDQLGLKALKNIILLESRLIVRSRDLEDFDGVQDANKEAVFPHPHESKFQRVKENLEAAYDSLGLICQVQKTEESDCGREFKMYLKFVAQKGFHSNETCVEQSLLSRDGMCSMVIEHIVVPGGKGLGREILDQNENLLKEEGFDCILLEAASGPRGLVGAFVWSRLGFKFASQLEAPKLKAELSRYLKIIYPLACPVGIKSWLNEQRLESPLDFSRLRLVTNGSMPWKNLSGICLKLKLLSPTRLLHLRFLRQSGFDLGKSFLLNPRVAASWNGVKVLDV